MWQKALWTVLALCLWPAMSPMATAQAVKGRVSADDPPPVLTYRGLVPGLDVGEKVRRVLGEPVFEARWYSYKLYYPAAGREGMFDVVHMHGLGPTEVMANVDAATVPEGYETGAAIRRRLGEPEYELAMSSWRLLDYSEAGLRFALDAEGRTIGVAYFPHGRRRVPPGERSLLDLSRLRQGPQPPPAHKAPLGGLRVGVSEVVISPTEKDWLSRPFKIHDDLKARTAVISRGELTVALVGADLFGMGWDEIDVIRRAAKEMGVDHLILAMSHNHAAPDTIGVYGHYPAEYIAYVQERVLAGVSQAYRSTRLVGELRAASRELPMDGVRVMDLFRNARNPGVLDPQLALIQAVDTEGGVIATLVHFACHVESLAAGARQISADFPGYLADQIRRDGGGQAVFLNGAVGGMVSGDNRERTHESSRQMGLKLAELVSELAATAQAPEVFHFEAEVRPIEIPMMNPRFKPLFESGLRQLKRGRVVSDMIYLRLGEAQLITLPGELLPEVSFEILEHMDGFPRMLVGLANDELGYMIPPYDFRDDAYEETMSQSPSAALIVRDTALRMLAGIR